jgi:hypothetical protein
MATSSTGDETSLGIEVPDQIEPSHGKLPKLQWWESVRHFIHEVVLEMKKVFVAVTQRSHQYHNGNNYCGVLLFILSLWRGYCSVVSDPGI